MLPAWNPDRLTAKIPFNLGLVGGRRMGKSSAVSDLLQRMRRRFDLIIAFIGSASCNPVLRHQMMLILDDRFFFSQWDVGLIERLLRQQEDLKGSGTERQVLILMDDVILNSKAEDQICHMAMRGRHFNVSLMMCSVSYTTMPKRMRRALDVILVFSCPMQGDMKILCWEFAHNATMAKFALTHLDDHNCLVLETLERRLKLFVWKANLLTLENEESPERARLKTAASGDSPSECRRTRRRTKSDDSLDRTLSRGASALSGTETPTEGPLDTPKNEPSGPE